MQIGDGIVCDSMNSFIFGSNFHVHWLLRCIISFILIAIGPLAAFIFIAICVPLLIFQSCCHRGQKICFVTKFKLSTAMKWFLIAVQIACLVIIGPFLALILVTILMIPAYIIIAIVIVRAVAYHCFRRRHT